MGETILRTKLFIPPLRSDAVSRPRLIHRLNRSLEDGCKLSLISAAAGSGKTSLAAEWIHKSGQGINTNRCAWLSLDSGHNNAAVFHRYLFASLKTIFPGLEEPPQEPLTPPASITVESSLGFILNQLALMEEKGDLDNLPRILVFDDYHLITEQIVHESVLFLLDNLLPALHLVIISRSDPPWSLSRLRANGQITELRSTDLNFNLDEAAEFLNGLMALSLGTSEIERLRRRTEGWIAGLQLAALSLRGLTEHARKDFISSFSESSIFITEYLGEEVLASVDESTKKFLLQTSILTRLSGPLCDAVTGMNDSDARLKRLVRDNLFIIPLDAQQIWYRYHHLFASLLSDLLDRTFPSSLPELHSQASAWNEANGFYSLAIEHALSAGDKHRAAGLIESQLDNLFMSGEFTTTLQWMDALPCNILQKRPRLTVYYGIAELLAGRPVANVEEKLLSAVEVDRDGDLEGELTLLRAVLATLAGDTQQAYLLAQAAMEQLSEDNLFLRGLLFRNFGAVFKMTGDIRSYRWAAGESYRIAQNNNDRLGLIVAVHQKAEVSIMSGQLMEGLSYCRRALKLAQLSEDNIAPPAIKILVTMADIFREQNDLSEASKCLDKALDLADPHLEIWSIGAHLVSARVRQAEGDLIGVEEALHLASGLAVAYDSSEIDDMFVDAQRARLGIMSGTLESAHTWADNRGLDFIDDFDQLIEPAAGARMPYHLREFELITYGRLIFAYGQYDDAAALLNALHQKAVRLLRTGPLIEILALQALTHNALGEPAEASGFLKNSLALAEPGGYIRLFVDLGSPMAKLVSQVTHLDSDSEYLTDLFDALELVPVQSSRSKIDQPLVEPLSDRELEVLRLLKTHMSSTEIAAVLDISANTVRFHTKNIYSKLGVHSRTQAVAQAQDLGLT